MLILALDLATTLGWCEGRPGETPISGNHRIAPVGCSDEELYGKFQRWLLDRLRVSQVDALVIETPFRPAAGKGGTNANTILRLNGLFAVALANGQNMGIPRLSHVAPQTVRKHFLGTGRPDNAKKAVMARCRALGFEPKDDNEADAIALWDYAAALYGPKFAARSTPLFGAR